MRRTALYLAGLALAACAAAAASYVLRQAPSPAQVPGARAVDIALVAADIKELLATYRKIVVLTDAQDALGAQPRALVDRVARQLAVQNMQRQERLDAALRALLASGSARRFDAVGALLDDVERDRSLFDADRLALRAPLLSLQAELARDASPGAAKLHQRVSGELDALAKIEQAYDREIGAALGRADTDTLNLKREKWESYVAHLKTLYQRDRILREHGVELPAGSEFLPELVPGPASDAGGRGQAH